MKVTVKGKGEVTLNQNHYVAQGGQAQVYARDGMAYKIYHDPKASIPQAKFDELSAIKDAFVVKPEDLIVGMHAGYTMKFLQDKYTLCQVFPRSFRQRNGVQDVHKLVQKLQERVKAIHAAGVLVVDLNELNILTDLTEVWMIDVDSYQTSSYRAEVIMPSVRDWTAKAFSELTDWFSFAVLACQLYLGIHPYKGTHKPSDTVPKDERLKHRMQHHISVFSPDVSVPAACYPLDAIPGLQRGWLEAVLQQGKRLPPPEGGAAAEVTLRHRRAGLTISGSLEITEVDTFGANVLDVADDVVLTEHGVFIRGFKYLDKTDVLIGSPSSHPVAVFLKDGYFRVQILQNLGTEALVLCAGLQIAKAGDNFLVRTKQHILEDGRHVIASVTELSTKLYEGCAIQNLLGSIFVSLFPASRMHYQLRMPELEDYQIHDAKFEGGVLMVVGSKQGKYDRLVFRFGDNYATYDKRTVEDITPAGLNFIVYRGICISITEEDKLESFSTQKDSTSVRVADASSDMRLMHVQGRVGFARGNKLYTMRLK